MLGLRFEVIYGRSQEKLFICMRCICSQPSHVRRFAGPDSATKRYSEVGLTKEVYGWT